MSQLKIYTASAGSGKTYRLVYEYLRVVFKRPKDFRHILAVTFTNKSTAEMKERIISDLQELSQGNDPGYKNDLIAELHLDEASFTQKAQEILTDILHNYGYLSITTIDRFFQKLIRSFARDINLSSVYDIELDTDMVMTEVIDQLIEQADQNERTYQHINEYTKSKIEEGKAWDLRKELIAFGKNVFSEKFQMVELERYEKFFESNEVLSYYQNRWKDAIQAFEKDLAEIGKKGTELAKKHNLTINDFSYKSSGPFAFFINLQKNEKNYLKYIQSSRLEEAILNPEKWGKSNEIHAISSQLTKLSLEAIDYINKNVQEYNSANALYKNFYRFALIIDILKTLKNYRDENDVMLISDAASLISKVMNGEQESFVFEKMGAQYHHFLIDEFQDTSTLQWNNFYPLIKQSIGSDHLSLIVGDVKQSIYRFRNGDWSLLLEKVEKDYLPGRTYKDVLDTNWRSSQQVVTFNNAMFNEMPSIVANYYVKSIANAPLIPKAQHYANAFLLAYDNQEQKLSDKSKKREGYVQVDFFALPAKDDKKEKDKKTETEVEETNQEIGTFAFHRLKEILDDAIARGYEQKDIAILIKRNSEANDIANYFGSLENNSYQFITEASLKLSESRIIQFILSALQFITDKKNRITESNLRYIYARYILQETDVEKWDAAICRKEEDQSSVITHFYEQIDGLKNLPVYDIVEQVIAQFSLQKNTKDLPYIQAFQDAIIEFYKRSNVSLPNFIEWWKIEGAKKSIKLSESQNAVRIMTIHKSKGLQFPITIIPFAEWNFEHSGQLAPILWINTQEKQFEENDLTYGLPIYPIKYEKQLLDSIFADHYLEEKQANYLDQLNNFYVACTRPEEELYIISTKKREKETECLNTYLYQAINTPNFKDKIERETIFLESFKSGTKTTKKLTKDTAQQEEFVLSHYEVGHGNMKMKLPSSAIVTKEITHGKLVHQILSEIKHLRDAEAVLANYHVENEAIAAVQKILAEPLVQEWFSDDAEVFLEQPILQKDGKVSIPDRVVIKNNEAFIIDFKTGLHHSKYHKQLQSYKEALRELGYEKVSAAILYITNLEIVQI